MNPCPDYRLAALSANERFKLEYPRALRGATAAAIALLVLLAFIAPEYRPQPYALRSGEITLVEIDLAPVVEEPPPVAAPLRLPPVFEPVAEGPVDEEYEFPPFEQVGDPFAPGPAPAADEPFVASSTKPELLHQAKPIYPEIARLAHMEGTVVVHVLVGVDGRVLEAVVVKGAHPLLDRAAVAAARQCRFRPGRQREMPVKAWLAVPYRFSLR